VQGAGFAGEAMAQDARPVMAATNRLSPCQSKEYPTLRWLTALVALMRLVHFAAVVALDAMIGMLL